MVIQIIHNFNLAKYLSDMIFLIWFVEDLYLPSILHYVVLDEVFNMLFPLVIHCVMINQFNPLFVGLNRNYITLTNSM